jgi:hypothetical protein
MATERAARRRASARASLTKSRWTRLTLRRPAAGEAAKRQVPEVETSQPKELADLVQAVTDLVCSH